MIGDCKRCTDNIYLFFCFLLESPFILFHGWVLEGWSWALIGRFEIFHQTYCSPAITGILLQRTEQVLKLAWFWFLFSIFDLSGDTESLLIVRRCFVHCIGVVMCRFFVGTGTLLFNESVNGQRLSPFVIRHRLIEVGRVLLLPIRGGL